MTRAAGGEKDHEDEATKREGGREEDCLKVEREPACKSPRDAVLDFCSLLKIREASNRSERDQRTADCLARD